MDLGSLLREEVLRARVTATDADEAIAAAGGLLVASGAANGRYVAAMQQALHDIGPYFVIAPGIALPHARPEDGAHGPGLSVVTLAEPIAFGHDANDPVDVVIAFAATDKTTLARALQQLAVVISDQQALGAMRAAATDRELLAAIRATLHAAEDRGPSP